MAVKNLPRLPRAVLTLVAVVVLLVAGALLVQRQQVERATAAPDFPPVADFIAIREVPRHQPPAPVGRDASLGRFVSPCGRNENGHHNADNVIASPGKMHGAQHVHEYVGNVSTDAFSTDASLAAAATTCQNGDRSTYYWPVLRTLTRGRATVSGPTGWDGGRHNSGTRVAPAAVLIEFRGNLTSKVVPMPRFLRLSTGNARAAATDPVTPGAPQWSCSFLRRPKRSTGV